MKCPCILILFLGINVSFFVHAPEISLFLLVSVFESVCCRVGGLDIAVATTTTAAPFRDEDQQGGYFSTRLFTEVACGHAIVQQVKACTGG